MPKTSSPNVPEAPGGSYNLAEGAQVKTIIIFQWLAKRLAFFPVWDKNDILLICRTAVEVIATVHKSSDSEAVLDKEEEEEEVTSTLGRLKGINASADCHLSRGEVMTSPPPDSVHTLEDDNQINESHDFVETFYNSPIYEECQTPN